MPELETRARLSRGTSNSAIYEMVARTISMHGIRGDVLVDVGCGGGQLWHYLGGKFAKYIGVDGVLYEDLPPKVEFHYHDFDSGRIPLPTGAADVVVALETIEHLENPRAFFRDLHRLTRPGGWLIVTTPNQLSLLSILTLIFKKQFNAFQDVHYPAHLSALLEADLKRIAAECGLLDVQIEYSCKGRIILTAWHYPRFLARIFPSLCSDNLLVIGRRPGVIAVSPGKPGNC
jgi:2-polyprenyl-3-methyl-5-hydroxy-6-metoxy-1,4-benzoquinol methylase